MSGSRAAHLVLLSEDFWPTVSGGAHEQWRFAQLAAARGHEVTVFTKRLPETSSVERVDGVEIRRPAPAQPSRLPPNHPLAFLTRIGFSLYLLAVLVRWTRSRDPDTVIAVSHLLHWVGFAITRLYDLPLVSYIGFTPSLNSEFSLRPDFVLERVNFAYFLGSPVFCRVPRVRSVLERDNDDVRIVHGIINVRRLEAVYESSTRSDGEGLVPDHDGPVLAFVGRLTEIKQPLTAIDVLSRLPDEFRLVIIGDGPLRERVDRAIQERGLADRIRCHGELPHRDTLGVLSAVDALLLTSRKEAYPTVVFEALALERPVFATPVGILPEIREPRLHIAPPRSLPELVVDHCHQSDSGLDSAVFEQYSMQRYAESILDTVGEQHE